MLVISPSSMMVRASKSTRSCLILPTMGTGSCLIMYSSQSWALPALKATSTAYEGMSHWASAPPPAREISGTTARSAQAASMRSEMASRSFSARALVSSGSSASMRTVGISLMATFGSKWSLRVASKAASVILSRRSTRASGFFFRRSMSFFDPTMMPAWGPPRSLSPLKDTRSAPSAMDSATVGSAYSP